MIGEMNTYDEQRDTFSFLQDIIKYTLERLELENLRSDNEYFNEVNPKNIIITVISSLTINLFKQAIIEVTPELELKMINDLMDKIKSGVVLSVMQKGDNASEQ